jgi:predicted ATPase
VSVSNFSIPANVADVGVGVSQVLPIIVLAHFVPSGSIILEQPEFHLHPSVQAVLAEFFYEVSIERNIQFIVETHSEHLLLRLQRRVAERKFWEYSQEDVKLYVSRRGTTNSEISELQLDPSGRIANWPPHFFGDTVSDREAIMKAYLKSIMEQSEAKMEDGHFE